MPLSFPITEEMVQRLAPDETTYQTAQRLVQENRISDPGVSKDGTWLLADARGSAHEPYLLSVDFLDMNQPVFRSSSPARVQPDKYSLALLLHYAKQPSAFGTREPSDDLIAKREKKQAQDAKKAGVFPARKSTRSAQEKKAQSQREGLEMIERTLVDLLAEGNWQKEANLEKLEKFIRVLNDHFVPGPTQYLRKLLMLGKQENVSNEEKSSQAVEVLGRLWTVIQKASAFLHGKFVESFPGEALLAEEEIFGHQWTFGELKSQNLPTQSFTLYELAYERFDDEARQQRIETSNLIDLQSGQIYQAIAYRSFKGLTQLPEQPSYIGAIQVPEGILYPGFVNRRIRWDRGAEQLLEETGKHLEGIYTRAIASIESVLEPFQTQLREALVPRECVILVKASTFGTIGKKTFLEDASGQRLELIDRSRDYSNVSNLQRGIGMLGKDSPACLVRLILGGTNDAIFGIPLALITNRHHLRLGV